MPTLRRPAYSAVDSAAVSSSAPQAPASNGASCATSDKSSAAADLTARSEPCATRATRAPIINAAGPMPTLTGKRAMTAAAQPMLENSGDIDAPASDLDLALAPEPETSCTEANAVAACDAGAAGPPAVDRANVLTGMILHCDEQRITLPALPMAIREACNERQLAYALRYVETANRKTAFVDSGYKPESYDSYAHNVHSHGGVQAAIVWILEQVEQDQQLTDDWLERQAVRLYREAVTPQKIYDKLGHYTGLMTCDRSNAIKALELIGKKRGLLGAKVVHEHKGSISLLLQAVASRGKPTLEARQVRTVDNSTGQVTDC